MRVNDCVLGVRLGVCVAMFCVIISLITLFEFGVGKFECFVGGSVCCGVV